jgi:hypothetical protein
VYAFLGDVVVDGGEEGVYQKGARVEAGHASPGEKVPQSVLGGCESEGAGWIATSSLISADPNSVKDDEFPDM